MTSENNAIIRDRKGIMTVFNPAGWSLKWKSRFNFLIRAIVAIGLLLILVNFFQRKIFIGETNNKLLLLSDTKSKYIENYFSNLDQQIRVFAGDRQTLDAFSQLMESFNNIESDNYLSESVTGLDRLNTLLDGFYKTQVLPQFESGGNAVTLKSLVPEDNKQRILQYLYLAANAKPMGSKSTVIKAEDASAYSYMHSIYHPEILNFARKSGIADILFVDYKTGYVVYSSSKNLDFATNLFEGPYKNSGLGMAFKSAIALQAKGSVAYTDATVYMPAMYETQTFLSTPIYSGSQLIGSVVFAISNNTIDHLLSYDQESINSAASLKSIIIGGDLLYRNTDPEFTQNKTKYIRKLKNHAVNGLTASRAERYGTTALVQGVDPVVFSGIQAGKQGVSRYTTETGSKVLCSYTPLHIAGLNWMLVTQIDKADALAPMYRFLIALSFIAVLIAIILSYLSGLITKSITTRLALIKDNIASLAHGERIEQVMTDSGDEIGSIGKSLESLRARLHETTSFMNELSKGNIDTEFTVNGDQDQYGLSMNKVRQSLILRREDEEKRVREDEIRNWTTQGIAMFNDILRMDNDNLEKLSANIIRNIVQYLSATQGGLFLMDEEGDQRKYLNLIATYAFDRQKFLKKTIEIGEGLAGTCVLEKKSILTNKIPDNYLMITSGLGGAKPTCLLVVPLKKDVEILGVLEIASFENFKPHEVEFVEKIAESIAAALITVKLHLQTTQYLERFQQQSEEMKAQDEELRQNIEELQATHEQMERMKEEENEKNRKILKEMEDYKKLLISVINEVPEKVFLKDDQGRFIIANKPVADNYNKTVDEILGKSDFDFYPKEVADEYFRHEQGIIASGKTQTFEEGDPSKYDGLIVRSIKKPFYIEYLGVTGLFGVQFDISDIKRKEYEANRLTEEIRQKQQEIEKASVELVKEKLLLDSLLTNVPDHIYFKDKESKFIRFSRSMLKLFKLENPEDLTGKSDFDFFTDEHARPAYEDEQSIMATGRAIIDLEEKEVHEDGRISWVNTTKMPLKDVAGNIIGTFGISKNISKIKNMETEALEMMKSIEKNRKLLIDILNKVPAKIFLKDENGTFVVVNEAVASVYDKTPEEIIGTSDYDNHPNEDVDSWRKQELEIVSTGEKVYLHKENQRYLNTIKTPFVLATTGKTGLLGMQLDVTDLKIMEEEVRQLREENKRLKIINEKAKGSKG